MENGLNFFRRLGQGAILHACQIGREVMIGMGAVIGEGCIIEEGAIIAAGAVIPAGTRVPTYEVSLVDCHVIKKTK